MKFKDTAALIIYAIIVLLILIISILLITNELNWESFSELLYVLRAAEPLSALIIAIGISLVTASIYSLIRWRKKQNYLKKNIAELLTEGGIKNKQVERMLYEYEKAILENLYQETKDFKYDLDCRSPVFKVQGRLYKQGGKPDPYVEVKERWFVKGVEITEDNYPPLRYQNFDLNDELVVEFSPRSHYIWDVYRVFDGKRNWFMYLAPEVWEQVAAGKITVVGRAPFGNHNLDKIRYRDVVTFSHLKSGRRVNVQVEAVHHYKSVEEMIGSEGLEKVMPNAKTPEEAAAFYESLYNYKERIREGGIYALRVKLIK